MSVNMRDAPTLELPILPARGHANATLEVGGINLQESTSVTVQWSATAEAALRSAWSVRIGDRVYRWQCKPLGVSNPYEIAVDVIEANRA